MELMTSFELSNKSEKELAVLFGSVSKSLIGTTRGSRERSQALASLENISRARAMCYGQAPR